MNPFHYHNQKLYCESVDLESIAKKYGTPCYIYSQYQFEKNYHTFDQAFNNRKHLICFSVKANSNIAILNLLARLGAGFDIVSGGELLRVLAAGGNSQKVVFSGVGKTVDDISLALKHDVFCFNVESISELMRLNTMAHTLQKKASIAIRVNPDIDAKSHPYISTGLKENKFGLSIPMAIEAYKIAQQLPHINIIGIDYHIGSQITQLSPFINAYRRIEELIVELEKIGISFSHIDMGGGLGICYRDEKPPTPENWIKALVACTAARQETIIIEPGRSISAQAGILLTQVEYLKQTETKNFAIVDAGMNDLIRPTLYQAWQNIIPVNKKQSAQNLATIEVVGPVCESSDVFATDRKLGLSEGDLLAICDVGAYGFSMSSNYNSRARPAEVLVNKENAYLIREREPLESLFSMEHIPKTSSDIC